MPFESTALFDFAVFDLKVFDVGPEPIGSSPISDSCTRAQARLLGQFQESTNLKALLCVLAARWDAIETATSQMRTALDLDSAYGVGLDFIGRRIGLRRRAWNDPTFQKLIQAEAQLVNRSGATLPTILKLVRFLVGEGRYIRTRLAPPAGYFLTIEGLTADEAALYGPFIARATAGGVSIYLQVSLPGGLELDSGTSPNPSNTTVMGSGTGTVTGDLMGSGRYPVDA